MVVGPKMSTRTNPNPMRVDSAKVCRPCPLHKQLLVGKGTSGYLSFVAFSFHKGTGASIAVFALILCV